LKLSDGIDVCIPPEYLNLGTLQSVTVLQRLFIMSLSWLATGEEVAAGTTNDKVE
jgi:hypothetical protein